MHSSILLKHFQVITLSEEPFISKTALSTCRLKWRRKVLFVQAAKKTKVNFLPALNNEQWLIDCLHHSSAQLIYLFPDLGEEANLEEENIIIWANACRQAGKKIALNFSRRKKILNFYSLSWITKRVLDWLAAAFLLVILSPLFLGLVVLIWMTFSGPLFARQWRVGYGGQLFQILKFRSMVVNAENKCQNYPRIFPFLGCLRRYSLDGLPQLINILRGEMTFVGPRPWSLCDVLQMNVQARKQRIGSLPGITGPWKVKAHSNLINLEAVSQCDLDYLNNWSLWKDIKILFLTIPRVILGSESY